jgi:hypothetical protein
MKQQGIKIDNLVDPSVFFQYLLAKNGPDKSDYAAFDRFIETVPTAAVAEFKTSLSAQYMEESIHGHVLRQPFGYAGDFLIIDKIYTQQCSDNFGKWDQYFHRHAAPKAVRNRKDYFKQNMARILRERKGEPDYAPQYCQWSCPGFGRIVPDHWSEKPQNHLCGPGCKRHRICHPPQRALAQPD